MEDHGIDLAPMLDFVLNLLIFFIITAIFIKELGLMVNRPSGFEQEDSKTASIPVMSPLCSRPSAPPRRKNGGRSAPKPTRYASRSSRRSRRGKPSWRARDLRPAPSTSRCPAALP